MEHLLLFEDFSEYNWEDFKNKIDWVVYEYIKDLSMKYIDGGDEVDIYIDVNYKNPTGVSQSTTLNLFKFTCNRNGFDDIEQYIHHSKDTINNVRYPDGLYICYYLSIVRGVDGIDKEEMTKILNTLLKKFNHLEIAFDVNHGELSVMHRVFQNNKENETSNKV